MGYRVAITGGTGFLGSALTKFLLVRGDEVSVLVRDETLPPKLNLREVRGDVRNQDDVERLIYESQPNVLYHLAAVAPVGHGLIAPRQTIETNVMGLVNVLDVIRRFGAETRIVVVSSDKAYGHPHHLPLKETTPLTPKHPYDASKAAADLIALSYQDVYPRMKIYILRPTNVYGPGDLHWNRLIPGCIRASLEKREFIVRSSGEFVRDYLYINDCVLALIAFVGAALEGDVDPGSVWNISAHQRFKVVTVIKKIAEVMGQDPNYKILGMAFSETRNLTVDGQKFKDAVGWRPAFSFMEGLTETVHWYTGYFKL